nr:MAG TPA: hypothetical protein [Bacteriophage sp.]
MSELSENYEVRLKTYLEIFFQLIKTFLNQ